MLFDLFHGMYNHNDDDDDEQEVQRIKKSAIGSIVGTTLGMTIPGVGPLIGAATATALESTISGKSHTETTGTSTTKSVGKSKYSKPQNEVDFSAPYNFIALDDKVMQAYEFRTDIPGASEIRPELLTGEINYTIDVRTPLLSENDENETFLTANMVRGLVHSNLQILSFSSIQNDIEDETFLYRSIGKRGKYYAEKMGAYYEKPYGTKYRNIRAGILYKSLDDYYIKTTDAFAPLGYYKLSISRIQNSGPTWRTRFNVNYGGVGNIFEAVTSTAQTGVKRNSSKSIKEPFYKLVSWEEKNGQVYCVGESNMYEKKAYIVSPGYMIRQNSYYLIPLVNDEKETIKVDSGFIEQFTQTKEFNRKKSHKFYALPKNNGSERPVFFIESTGRDEKSKIEFGYTLLFPISYEHSVNEGLPQKHREQIIDYDKAIFGFRDDTGYCSGRLSFLEPTIEINNGTYSEKVCFHNPKPTSCKNYINGDEGDGYNSESFSLNGIKQYWLHENVINTVRDNKSIYSEVSGAESGTVFKGTIKYFNLSPQELGLVVWSLGLNDDSQQNIGAGKQYGYGRIKIEIDSVYRYKLTNEFVGSFDFSDEEEKQEVDSDECITAYRRILNDFVDGKLSENQRLQDFFLMKNEKLIPEEKYTAYVGLRAHAKLKAFPQVTDVVSSKEWIIVPSQYLTQIPEMSWEEFLANPPEEIKKLHPEYDIYLKYREICELVSLFEINRTYYVRREILDDLDCVYQELQTLFSSIKKRNRRKNNQIFKHILTCEKKTKDILLVIKKDNEIFENEAVIHPVMDVKSCLFDSKNELLRLVVSLSVNDSCPPVRVKSLMIYSGEEIVCQNDQKFYISGSKSEDIEMEIKPNHEQIKAQLMTLRLSMEYRCKVSEVDNTEYTYIYEAPIVAGEFETLHNPYSSWLGNAVSDRDMFFGRKRDLNDVVAKVDDCSNRIVSGKNIIIYGQKRTGKSTLVYFIREELKKKSDKYIVVDVGNIGSILQSDENSSSVNLRLFFKTMIDEIESVLEDDYPDIYDEIEDKGIVFPRITSNNNSENMAICTEFIKKLVLELAPEKRLVLCIDEFTYFYDRILRHQLDEGFMKFWKAFIENTKVCTILAAQDFMDDFINAFPNEFGAADKIRISYLNKKSAKELINTPFERSNRYAGFADEAQEYIYELTAGNAYFTMCLCSNLVDYLNELEFNRVISKNVVDQFFVSHWMNMSDNKRLDKAFFESLYADGCQGAFYNEDNLYIMKCIAENCDENGWTDLALLKDSFESIDNIEYKIERLLFRDVLIRKGNKLKIKVQLFSLWLRYSGGRVDD